MKILRLLRSVIPLVCATALHSQTAPPSGGMVPDWDVGAILTEISAHAGRLLPALERLDTGAWIAKGASDTYAAQLQSGKEQVKALAAGAQTLAGRPQSLSAGLEVFFRMQAVETILGSLVEGARKYQSPADASELAKLIGENGANRERFQQWLVDLAAEREQQFRVMDQEAQRCRGILSRQTPAVPSSSGRKK